MSGAETGRTLVTADFAGRPCRFQLRLGEMAELERLCGAGIGAVFMRLGAHQSTHRDVWDTIRLGLEGGGMSGLAASALVLRDQDEPLMDYLPLAGRITAAAVNSVPRELDEVRRMTLAEWHVVVAAFIVAHGPPEAGGGEEAFLAALTEEMAVGRA